jgi:hypothetical protein
MKKRNCWAGLFLALVFTAGAKNCDEKKTATAETGKEVAAIASNACQNDDDCVELNKGCCGCHEGGSKIAVLASKAQEIRAQLEAKCKDSVCMQMISKHKSCAQKPVCNEKKECELR